MTRRQRCCSTPVGSSVEPTRAARAVHTVGIDVTSDSDAQHVLRLVPEEEASGRLRAEATKASRADAIPLRADLAESVGSVRGEAGDGDRIFSGVPLMKEHRRWLAAARNPLPRPPGPPGTPARAAPHLRHDAEQGGRIAARGDGTDAAYAPSPDDEGLHGSARLRSVQGVRETSGPLDRLARPTPSSPRSTTTVPASRARANRKR